MAKTAYVYDYQALTSLLKVMKSYANEDGYVLATQQLINEKWRCELNVTHIVRQTMYRCAETLMTLGCLSCHDLAGWDSKSRKEVLKCRTSVFKIETEVIDAVALKMIADSPRGVVALQQKKIEELEAEIRRLRG